MRQVVIGAIGIAVGVFVGVSHMVPRGVSDVAGMKTGRWKGGYVVVEGSVRRTDEGTLILSGDSSVALRVEGDIPAGQRQLRGRVRKGRGVRTADGAWSVLPYVLDTSASVVDLSAIVGFVVAAWGALLVFVGIRLRRRPAEEEERA